MTHNEWLAVEKFADKLISMFKIIKGTEQVARIIEIQKQIAHIDRGLEIVREEEYFSAVKK